MKIETDPKRVAMLARRREDANWRFRSFLKGCDLSASRLDRLVHEVYERVSAAIDCRACANCCKVITPTLTPADIRRLAAHLGLTSDEFTARFLHEDEDEGGWVFEAGPCPFLANNECTVYEHRPDACRSFPHLHKRNFRGRLTQAVTNTAVCPIVYHVFEELKAELWHDRGAEGEWP